MTKIYKCKCHGRSYTLCPHCDCQYCPEYWAHCPRCANIRSALQGDPRGAALYILRPDDVIAGASVDS